MVKAATRGHSGKAATRGHLRPLGKSGHLRPLEWLRVAASGCFLWDWNTLATRRRRPLAVTCGHSTERPLAATCGHSSGCEWLQVAAFLKFKYRAECNPNGKNRSVPWIFGGFRCFGGSEWLESMPWMLSHHVSSSSPGHWLGMGHGYLATKLKANQPNFIDPNEIPTFIRNFNLYHLERIDGPQLPLLYHGPLLIHFLGVARHLLSLWCNIPPIFPVFSDDPWVCKYHQQLRQVVVARSPNSSQSYE